MKISLPCPKGCEELLKVEALNLGLKNPQIKPALVYGEGDLKDIYNLILWSRLASRVLLNLFEGKVENPEEIYQAALSIDWQEHLDLKDSFAVKFSGLGAGIKNTQFAALKIKDAVADKMREIYKNRPSVNAENPDLAIDCHLHKGILSINLDLSAGALHQRGYRLGQGEAPLKENLASLLLYRSSWEEISKAGGTLIDPMCGSATILIEAIYMAADIAPAIKREKFGFLTWLNHKPLIWKNLFAEAIERKNQGLKNLKNQFWGFDINPSVLKKAKLNLEQAGFLNLVSLKKQDISEFKFLETYGERGLIITNPPYGERMGELSELATLYSKLGFSFKTFPELWNLSLISSNEDLLTRLKLRSKNKYQAFNGNLEAKIINYNRENQLEKDKEVKEVEHFSNSATMFFNRLRKNQEKIAKILKNKTISAYRIYDKDLPEYAVAIDIYNDYALVYEYAAPKEIPEEKSKQRLLDILEVIPQALNIEAKKIILKERKRQRDNSQYQKLEKKSKEIIVLENQAKFYINLYDYLDTGLFLDHRIMRQRIYAEAKNKRILNLFSYTGSVSVFAGLAGAKKVVSVDLSQNYLDWTKRNLKLNGLEKGQFLEQADVMEWLSSANHKFDIIFLDPPTFSNTKKKNRVFDVQSNHYELIKKTMKRLEKNGILYFSNNYRDFKLEEKLKAEFSIVEITSKTIDFDFQRNQKIHRVWEIKFNQ